jgi:hypothetical protein
MAEYELVCVARIPQANTAPFLFEIDPIDFDSLQWVDELNQPQQLDVQCLVSKMTLPVRQRLQNLAELATELWLYRDGIHVFAGPLVGWEAQDSDRLTLHARGLLFYLRWMVVDEDLTFTGDDMFTIAASLIDQWQDLEFGNFGIETGNVGLSGATADSAYVKTEFPFVLPALEELSKSGDGFDFEVDPASRNLRLWYPKAGVDRSVGDDAIVFDASNIESRTVKCSAGPDDLASAALVTSTDTEQGTLFSAYISEDLLVTFGRSAIAQNLDKVTDITLLDQAAEQLSNSRRVALLVPGPTTRVTADTDLSRYQVGDTVFYDLHDTLEISGPFRVRKRTVDVADQGGRERAGHEFV